jgi:hypothetical protein
LRFPYKVKDAKSIQKNFDYLAGILTNLMGGSGAGNVGIRFGTSTMAWAASTDSGPKTITHGLGKTPVVVFVTNGDTVGSYPGIAAFTVLSVNSTTFDTYGRTAGAITGTKAIFWVALG